MRKLANWSTTHRLYVVIGWVALIVVVNVLGLAAGTEYSSNFTLPHSGSQNASDLLQRSFSTQAGDRDQIVFSVSSGKVTNPEVRARMSSMFAKVATLPHVTSVVSPYANASAGQQISRSGQIAFATVVFNQRANVLPTSAAERVVSVARAAQRPGLEVELGGQAIEATNKEGFGLSTKIALLAAIVILLITFGSVVAMGLPILTALCGLGTGLGLIELFTHIVDTPNFSSELAAMIGLGVGIDYALFIVTRFREIIATPGPTFGDVRASVVQAMDSAGRAVLFAGCTVVIALLGMMLLGVSFLYGVALSASIGVLMVMLASLTLLPALMTFAGRRLARPSRRARRRAAAGEVAAEEKQASEGGVWLRWSRFVQRRPWAVATVAAVVMLAIAAPATALRLGSSDASNDPPSSTTHHAYELLAKGFGKGYNGPLLIVARASAGGGLGGVHQLSSAIASTPGVALVTPTRTNPAGNVATFSAYPRSSPQEYATTELVTRLRSQVIPPLAGRQQLTVYVGGVTAGGIDFANTLGEKLPLFIGVVVLLSALLLMIVFRSLVIPLQAAIMNLLSIGASLGVIVMIFQWGWLRGLMGVSSGPIESFIPVMLFAIVFGLSMDYEVFLVSRIHERWTRSEDSSRAVGEGLALTGRVITAAAAIMVCVFLSFMVGDSRVIKEFGLSLASAVFLDALVVRCLLLPAVLEIIGARTWMIPSRLHRSLPRINIEGGAPVVEHPSVGDPSVEQPSPERPTEERLGHGRGTHRVPGVAAEGADG